jgi:hypothetical protein
MTAVTTRTSRAPRRGRGEGGVTLVLALAFISLLGASIVGLLALTDTSFRTTPVVRSRTDMLYAADGGADYALEQIRTTATSACPPGITAVPPIDGVTPSITATCTGGTSNSGVGSSLLGEYSAIALGSGGISQGGSVQQNDNLTVKILGSVYSGGGLPALNGDANTFVVEGNASLAGATCPYTAATDPRVTGTCLAGQGPPAVSQTSPTVVVPTVTAPGLRNGKGASKSCTILYPGRYTSKPNFNPNRGYYLASGTYYFQNIGDLNLKGWIQGGAPGATTPTLSSGFSSRCPTTFANDTNAKALRSTYDSTGSGVNIILGNNSVLRFPDSTSNRVELFPRVPAAGSPDLAATAGVSIWGQRLTTNGVTVPANYTRMTQTQAIYTSGRHSNIVFHGLVWLPDSRVQVSPMANSLAGGAGQLSGGVVADSIVIWADNVTGGVTSTVAGSGSVVVAVPRTVTITSTATPLDGGAATTVKVVATYPTTANGYPTIVSWRKV